MVLSEEALSRAIDVVIDRHGITGEERERLRVVLTEYHSAVSNLEPDDRREMISRFGSDGLFQVDISNTTREDIFDTLFGDRSVTTKRDRFYNAARNMGRMMGI